MAICILLFLLCSMCQNVCTLNAQCYLLYVGYRELTPIPKSNSLNLANIIKLTLILILMKLSIDISGGMKGSPSGEAVTTTMGNDCHPLHNTLTKQRSILSDTLLALACSVDRPMSSSFVPRAFQPSWPLRGREG